MDNLIYSCQIGGIEYSEDLKRVLSADDNIRDATIRTTVEEICDKAFYNCHNLSSIKIPSSVKRIGHRAFSKCCNLTSVIIPPSVVKIDNEAFMNCGIKSLMLSNNINLEIGHLAFAGCSELLNITIPNVKHIGDFTFLCCGSLKQAILSNGIANISNFMFANCSSLHSVELPSSLNRIGDGAFYNCSNLSKVNIPNDVTIGLKAFQNCVSLDSSILSLGAQSDKYNPLFGVLNLVIKLNDEDTKQS